MKNKTHRIWLYLGAFDFSSKGLLTFVGPCKLIMQIHHYWRQPGRGSDDNDFEEAGNWKDPIDGTLKR